MKILLIFFLTLISFAVFSQNDTTFYDNGIIKKIKFHTNEKLLYKIITFHKNGNKKGISNYNEFGTPEGEITHWHENGQKSFLSHYREGYEYGDNNYSWSEDGVIESHTICINDTCTYIEYYTSGKPKSVSKSTKIILYYKEEWCENGQLKMVNNPNSDTIEHIIQYDCNGKIFLDYYKDGKGNKGKFIMYHQNGQIGEQGSFEKTDSPFGDQKVGLWEGFTSEGKKTYEEFYENGEVVKIKTFK